ncbi:hypothetical protein SE17_20095 [Kouleothrix aurantiaca]|uniref:Uncharacterized protein n=1 Tax=Kouleothrix aurantiaca TaxID=186479 RepID=A0A0P9HB54_9CHLR|nr:hypothetical protein SE17_20095 [Kouleothrix aurantiaca]
MTTHLFAIDVPAGPETERARLAGVLEAKREAYTAVEALKAWGGRLLILVLLTSAFHLFSVLSGVTLPEWVHVIGAVFQVVSIDATALFTTTTRGAVQLAGRDTGKRSIPYFLGLTAVLNAVFLLAHTPGLPTWAVSLQPHVRSLAVALLMLFFPIAVAAVEHSRSVLNEARLLLLQDIRTAETVLGAGTHSEAQAPAVSVTVNTLNAVQVTGQPQHPHSTHSAEEATAQWVATEPQSQHSEPALLPSTPQRMLTAAQDGELLELLVPSVPATADDDALVLVTAAQEAEPVMVAVKHKCPRCGTALKSAQAQGAAVRNGYCLSCKPV